MDQKTDLVFQPIKWDGKPVKLPGLYDGMPIERYHSAECCVEPCISSSGLRVIFGKSPKHYWVGSPYNKNRIEKKETKALALGRAAHHLLFGEAAFKSKFAIRPDMLGGVKWTGKGACKVWMEQRKAEGKTVILATQAEQIKGMARALAAEPLVKAGVLNGLIEHSLFWKDIKTGIWLRVRPDAMPNSDLDFVDLKTTTSIDYQTLQYTIRDYGYYQQAALIAEGCQAVFGRPLNSFTLVFVESEQPHDVVSVTLKDVDIDRGMQANRYALSRFAECMKSKKWPGHYGDQNDGRWIEMREYDQKDIDARVKHGD